MLSPYFWSTVVLLALGVVLLVAFVVRMFGAVRRFRAAQKQVTDDVTDRAGLLRARVAAVRVAIAERRHGATSRP